MLGQQSPPTDLFQCVTMEQLVPADHLLRRLRAALDPAFLDRIRDTVRDCYSPDRGRPSLDPTVVVRMWLLQHLYGLSERQLVSEIRMHAGMRWFCGLSFNDPIPDQSTLVKLRTQAWAQTDVWEQILQETVRLCEAAGIARPERLGIDGTQIDANAATRSLAALPPPLTLIETAPPETATDPSPPTATPADPPPSLTAAPGGRPQGPRRSGDPEWQGERFSNQTHQSTTDPEARLYRKSPGQEADLRYLGHYLADVASGVIYGATATQATGTAEREAALALLDGLPVRPEELVVDRGYVDGKFLAAVRARGVQPLAPMGKEALEAEPHWQRRTCDLGRLRRRREKRAAVRARNATRQASRGRYGAQAQRQRTRLEHLFAEGKEWHGLRRARGRGRVRVEQQVQLTAAVQNLKRLLGSGRRRAAAAVLGRLWGWLGCCYGARGAAGTAAAPSAAKPLARGQLAAGSGGRDRGLLRRGGRRRQRMARRKTTNSSSGF